MPRHLRTPDLQQRAREWWPKPYFAVPTPLYRRLAALFRRYGHVGPPLSSDYDGWDEATGGENPNCAFEALHGYVAPERLAACRRAIERLWNDGFAWEEEPEVVPGTTERRCWVSVPAGTERVEVEW